MDESNIRPIFRRSSPLRKPAALLGMVYIILIWPFYAVYRTRDELRQALQELVGVLK